ncbi:hypothetical protein C4564_00415 [Candidatus Microgenomates bacterium]|nr:MAG: hypothetical protein C4564_00415 [Candidatus Microgenomates bacterium]
MGKIPLFITALHGDEGFGADAIKDIESKLPKDQYQWIIGNPEAYTKGVRYIEADLNRIAPGNINSKIYEERRAAELVNLSSSYSFIIDIHGTNANSGIFVLITNPTPQNVLLAAMLPIKNVVIWASKKSKVKGPLTQFTYCPAVEIECGPKLSNEVIQELKGVLLRIIIDNKHSTSELLQNSIQQKYYEVYGTATGINTKSLKEFEKVKIDDEEFYPLLINSYENGSVRKMRVVNFFNLLAHD